MGFATKDIIPQRVYAVKAITQNFTERSVTFPIRLAQGNSAQRSDAQTSGIFAQVGLQKVRD